MEEAIKFWEDIRDHGDTLTNARSIAREKLERLKWLSAKMKNNPSESLAQLAEREFGLTADWGDADHGEGPRK